MFGFFLILGGTVFGELGLSIGKREAERKHAAIYTLGFLNMLLGAIFMILFGVFLGDGFRFGGVAALPTMLVRGVLEILQIYLSLHAFVEADRSAYGFIRIITIPLLLAVDMALGYPIGLPQVLGICIVVAALILLFINHGIARKGAGWVVASATNAVITISLYKYDVTHFNSVAFEQTAYLLLLTAFLFGMAMWKERSNPFTLLRNKVFLMESLAMGVGQVLISYGYLFAAASVATTMKRSFEVLASIISGRALFGEKRLVLKLLTFALIIAGLFLLQK